jgi:transcriptional regulator with XRE-family HTH domain
MKDKIDAAKLTMAEVAKIIGVSRITVYKWCKGTKPHRLVQRRLEVFDLVVKRLQETGTLPFPADLDKGVRALKVERIREVVYNRSNG